MSIRQIASGPVARPADEAAMVCRMIFDELCVLANGDIVCSCGDPSGIRVYGNVLHDRIADVYDGMRYREMRGYQLHAPVSSYCPVIGTPCGGRVSRATSSDRETGRVVKVLQLEPISYCNLKCPGCPATVMHVDPAYRDDRAAILPLAAMLAVVDQLPDLEKILFYNFGEPFLHHDAIPFLREVRRRRPEVILHTSTNGLALTEKTIEALAQESLADRVLFSIDGARETSYRQYRVKGSLARALANMKGLVEACQRAGTSESVEVIWQYILFEWNDSDEELEEARRRAADIGVSLKWVFTHTPGASRRFVDGSEAAARLFADSDPYAALTCDARMQHLWKHLGVASGRYRAKLTPQPGALTVAVGGRALLRLEVENQSRETWRSEEHLFRVGALLRDSNGKSVRELKGVALPAVIHPGEQTSVLIDLVVQSEPGAAEIFLDVVEDGVCWFSERSSTPVVVPLEIVAGSAIPWPIASLVSIPFESLLGKRVDEVGLAYWSERIEAGLPLETFLRWVADEACVTDRVQLARVREQLASCIDAG